MDYKNSEAHPPGFVPPPPYTAGPPPAQQYPDMRPGVIVVQPPVFGSETQRLSCPHCAANISTRIETEASSKTHLFALLLCIVGCWCCAPFVYCADSCLVKKHFCPACDQYLGQYDN